MGTACSRCHTPVAIDQAKCPVCGSAGIYEVSQLHIDKRKLDSDKRKLNVDKIREAEEEAEQIAKEEEAPKQQEHDNSVAANAALKQKPREKTIFITVMALILIGVAFSYTVFFGL